MATAYYRPPEKRVTDRDYMREAHYKDKPLAVGTTANGHTEIITVYEAEGLIEAIKIAVEHARAEQPSDVSSRHWK